MSRKTKKRTADAAHISSSGEARRVRMRTLLICAMLAAAVWVVFGQVTGHQFVNYDDDAYINKIVGKGLTWDGIRWAFVYGEIGHWHPLTWMSHMLDCQLFGVNPAGHHLTSLLLHMGSVILLFLVFQRMTACPWRSAFVAAVFAVHPLRAESVAWIAERKDVLAAFFFVLTLGAYAAYVRKPSVLRYALVALVFALGLLSKNMLVTLPAVLLLLDYWPLRRLTPENARAAIPRLLLEKIPLVALSIGSVIATLTSPEKLAGHDRMSLATRLSNALDSYVTYLWQTFVPVDLVAAYPVVPIPLWKSGVELAALAAITAAALLMWKRRPYFIVGWLWFLGMLLPVIGIVQISYYAHADRYTYLPQIGLCLIVAWGAADLLAGRRERRWIPGAAAAAAIVTLMILTHDQVSTWKTSEALWKHALAHSRDNAVAHYSLADEWIAQNKLAEADSELRQALTIKPDYPFALNALGNQMFAKSRFDDAVALLERAIAIQPDYAAARNNLGNTFISLGRLDEAVAQLKEASRLSPIYPQAQNNWGNALMMQNHVEEAIGHYHRALEIDPDYVSAHTNFGNALNATGRRSEAIEQFRLALMLTPNDPSILYNFGNVLLMQDKYADAIVEYQRAIELKPDMAAAHANLGIALASTGRSSEAIEQYQRALELSADDAETHNNIGVALIADHRPEAAIEHYRRAVELKPGYVEGHINLANALSSRGRFDAAIEQFQLAVTLSDEKNPSILDGLANAYASGGRIFEARETGRRALELANSQGNTALAAAIRTHIDSYKQPR